MIKDYAVRFKNILQANKRKVYSAIVLCMLVGALGVGAAAMFRVNGVVTAVDQNHISVTNFFRTQTVDLTGSIVNANQVKVGDRVEIRKNLQGQVLYARTFSAHNEEGEREKKGKIK